MGRFMGGGTRGYAKQGTQTYCICTVESPSLRSQEKKGRSKVKGHRTRGGRSKVSRAN